MAERFRLDNRVAIDRFDGADVVHFSVDVDRGEIRLVLEMVDGTNPVRRREFNRPIAELAEFESQWATLAGTTLFGKLLSFVRAKGVLPAGSLETVA